MTSSLKEVEKEMKKKEARIKELEKENEKLRELVGNETTEQTEKKPSESIENEKESEEDEVSGSELFIEAYNRGAL